VFTVSMKQTAANVNQLRQNLKEKQSVWKGWGGGKDYIMSLMKRDKGSSLNEAKEFERVACTLFKKGAREVNRKKKKICTKTLEYIPKTPSPRKWPERKEKLQPQKEKITWADKRRTRKTRKETSGVMKDGSLREGTR